MSAEREPIGVIGVGWVGLVTAACFAELGHPVIARDILPEKVEALSSGAQLPIHEPGLDELVRKNADRLTFTTEMSEVLDNARLLFVCVDTPPTASGDADLSRVRAVVEELDADGDHVLVMKSTVPAGTGNAIRRDLPDLAYVSCPEFLKEGSAIGDFLNPDRVVVGADPGDEEAGDLVAGLYEPLGGELVRTDVTSAEMVKLASNAFLATKISFINEIANVCEEVGADVREVSRGMGLDERIGPKFLNAGIGWGGSCFGKDTIALKKLAGNSGYHFQLLSAVIEVNELQKRRVVGKLKKHLGSLAGKRIALLGLAFKPDTDDMRDASSLVLAARLEGEGAEAVAYDPIADREGPGAAAGREARLLRARGARGRRGGGARDRVARVRRARLGRGRRPDGAAADRRRTQLPRPRRAARRRVRVRGDRRGARPRARPDPGRVGAMQAIVLVGGEGTRLRPLTETVPKPALTLVDRPMLAYTIEWLAGHGVDEVVLACGFLPDVLREALAGEEERTGATILYAAEPEPLGTAGAIRFAAAELGDGLGDRFLALNGDVLTDLDLTLLQRAHEESGRAGDDRPLRGRGLLRLRPGQHRARRRGHRVRRKDRPADPGRDQRRCLRPRALGARADRAGRRTSRSSSTSSRA